MSLPPGLDGSEKLPSGGRPWERPRTWVQSPHRTQCPQRALLGAREQERGSSATLGPSLVVRGF